MLPTIDDVLAMPAMTQGRPRVVAGAGALDRPVRWVHVAPVSGSRRLLLGGELLLATGVGWPSAAGDLEAYVDELVAAGVAGLVLELGDRFDTAPPALAARCRRAGLPLITLDREVRFVSITEAVHARIIDSQSLELRERDRVHDVFAELNRRGCTTEFLLDQVARMLRSAVVLEDLNHRALAWSSFDRDPGAYLLDWSARSRGATQQSTSRPAPYENTTYWPAGGWLSTSVEAHGRSWGRLVAIGCDEIPATGEAVLENAALSLSLARLAGGDEWTHTGHRALLDGLAGGSYVTLDDLRAAFVANGFRIEGRTLVAVARRRADDSLDAVLEAVRDDAPRRNLDVVCATWPQAPDTSIFLLSYHPDLDSPDDAITTLLARAAGDGGERRTVLAVGPRAATFDALPASADAAIGLLQSIPPAGPDGMHVRHSERAALATLMYRRRTDPELQRFVERVLGPLLAYDAQHHGDLVAVAGAYVRHPTNRKAAAAACHLSRSVFYQRLETIERLLGIDLRDGEAVGALQVALVAHAQR